MKIAVVVAQFNPEVTNGLLDGAKKFLTQEGEVAAKDIDVFEAPGAFEIPLIAKKLAQSKRYAGVVCLGAVIKGDTMHFEFISLGATVGLIQASLETDTPITFGILTTLTDEQAAVRSRNDAHNKGIEAAAACIHSIRTLQRI